jgi:hypothetical protein
MTSRWAFLSPVDTIRSGRGQIIFHPIEFPAAPAGKMVNIYVRYGVVPGAGSNQVETVYPEFAVKMGYTEKTGWATNVTHTDTFIKWLTMVHYNPLWKRKFFLDTLGTWIKLPVNAGDFRYDPNRRFVVEFSSNVPKFYVEVGSHGLVPNTRILTGFRDSATGRTLGITADFGFDLAPTAVEQITGLIALGLFPNPATNGRMNLSFETSTAVKSAAVNILDVTGREVWKRQYSNVGTSFFRELDLKELPPGQYLMNLILDGGSVSRKVIIQ